MEYIMMIAGKEVKITFMPPDVECLKDSKEDTEADGDYNTQNHEIRIVTHNKNEEALKGALVHEVVHAVFGVSGLWQHLQGLDDGLEELICANLQSFLAPLIEFRDDSMVPIKPKKKRKKKQ